MPTNIRSSLPLGKILTSATWFHSARSLNVRKFQETQSITFLQNTFWTFHSFCVVTILKFPL